MENILWSSPETRMKKDRYPGFSEISHSSYSWLQTCKQIIKIRSSKNNEEKNQKAKLKETIEDLDSRPIRISLATYTFESLQPRLHWDREKGEHSLSLWEILIYKAVDTQGWWLLYLNFEMVHYVELRALVHSLEDICWAPTAVCCFTMLCLWNLHILWGNLMFFWYIKKMVFSELRKLAYDYTNPQSWDLSSGPARKKIKELGKLLA